MGNSLLKTLLRTLIIAGCIMVSVAAPLLWIPLGAVAGLFSFRLMRGVTDRSVDTGGGVKESRKERENARREAEARKVEEALREKTRYYSPETGWRAEALPFDMELNVPDRMSLNAFIDVAGMSRAVRAVYTDDGAVFSVHLPYVADARRAADIVADRRLSASVRRDGGGGFVVESGRPGDIVALFKVMYPSREVSYEREVVENRQYVITGCSSYEEAVEKVRREGKTLKPDNTYVLVGESVGDRRAVSGSGYPLDRVSVVSLPTGAYVVTESVRTAEHAVVMVPGDVTGEEDIREFAGRQVRDSLVRTRSSSETTFSDSTAECTLPPSVLLDMEVEDRRSNPRLDGLDEDMELVWRDGAARISRVDVRVDEGRGLLIIDSCVDGVTRREQREVTRDEAFAFQSRGTISLAERKDLLMQAHPDFFPVYRREGGRGGIYRDPVGDFIMGERPERVRAARRTVNPERKPGPRL